jgi:hypothetical protein
MERLSREDWRERAEAQLKVAQRLLVAEVEKLQSGDDWRRYLAFQARLHCYSPRNVMLLAIQHERAYQEGRVLAQELTQVAGFDTWRMLGRSVDRSQKGYAVLAPVRYPQRVAVDDEGDVRPLGRREWPNVGETLARRQSLRGFKVEFVFDVSQTSGQDLPVPPRPKLLVGEAPVGLGAAVMKLIEDSGYRVDTVPGAGAIGRANGITDFAVGTVLIRSDMDDAAMVKTLLHEAAHCLLHAGPPGQFFPRPLKEVEAESAAFLVAAAHGMSTGDYSFPYVATWAGTDGTNALLATEDRVATVARQIMRASPAPHGTGGRAPGTEAELRSQLQRRVGLERGIEVRGTGPLEMS